MMLLAQDAGTSLGWKHSMSIQTKYLFANISDAANSTSALSSLVSHWPRMHRTPGDVQIHIQDPGREIQQLGKSPGLNLQDATCVRAL